MSAHPSPTVLIPTDTDVSTHSLTRLLTSIPRVLQLPHSPQAPLPIDEHAPPLAAPRPAPEARDHGAEPGPVDLGVGVVALAAARERQHLVVKGARLQPDGGDAEGAGLLEDAARHGGRRDDADGGAAGVGEVAEGGERGDDGGGAVGGGVAGDGDGRGGGVDGDGGDGVVEVPGEDSLLGGKGRREVRWLVS